MQIRTVISNAKAINYLYELESDKSIVVENSLKSYAEYLVSNPTVIYPVIDTTQLSIYKENNSDISMFKGIDFIPYSKESNEQLKNTVTRSRNHFNNTVEEDTTEETRIPQRIRLNLEIHDELAKEMIDLATNIPHLITTAILHHLHT